MNGSRMPIPAVETSVSATALGKSGRSKTRLMTGFGLVWLAGVTAGLAWLAAYDNAPGAPAHAPGRWPQQTHLVRDTAGPTLVLLAHPRCVCTRATLGELAELMARAHDRPKAYVVFIKPTGTSTTWDDTDLWRIAERIPGVNVLRDDDGQEVERFGAETSGQALLYDATGKLIFGGGITGSRGHPGDNIGRASILALLNREAGSRPNTSVFGCPLFAEHDRRQATR